MKTGKEALPNMPAARFAKSLLRRSGCALSSAPGAVLLLAARLKLQPPARMLGIALITAAAGLPLAAIATAFLPAMIAKPHAYTEQGLSNYATRHESGSLDSPMELSTDRFATDHHAEQAGHPRPLIASESEMTWRGTVCPELANPGNCQKWDNVTLVALTTTGPGPIGFTVADDFSPGVTGSITSVCWWGFYGMAQEFAPANETFFVAIYPDVNGIPGDVPLDIFVTGTDAVLSSTTDTFATTYRYSADLDRAVGVQAGGAYWLEIYSADVGTDGGPFRWLTTTQGPLANDVLVQDGDSLGDGYRLGDVRNGRVAWCMDIEQGAIPGHDYMPPPNDVCTMATQLVQGQTISGTNVLADSDVASPCGTSLVDGAGVWYRVTNLPQIRFTVTTCNQADFDTVINVYCGQDCTDLVPIACNDDAPGCANGTSSVTWVSDGTVPFWVHVYGKGGIRGEFDLSLIASPTSDQFDDCEFCEIDLGQTDALEADINACGTDANALCTTAEPLSLNTTYGGKIFAENNMRDVDTWRFFLAEPMLVDVRVKAEFPPLFQMSSGTCGSQSFFPPLLDNVCNSQVPSSYALEAGQHQIQLTAPTFNGVPCGQFTDYTLLIEPSERGACCHSDGTCNTVPRDQCPAFVCDVAQHLPPSFSGCFADVDGSGVVNASDRGFLAANIGQTSSELLCMFDVDGDGVINASDRGFVSANIALCASLPDYQDGSGLNDGEPDARFNAVFLGEGTACSLVTCPLFGLGLPH